MTKLGGPRYIPRPATRVGRTVIFPGGRTVRLSRWAHLLHALGVRKSLSTPHHERRSP